MNLAVEKINEIDGISYETPEGSVYVWLNFTAISHDDQAICDKLLYDAKVAIVPGRCFGATGIGYARLSLGQDISLLDEAINRIKKVLIK